MNLYDKKYYCSYLASSISHKLLTYLLLHQDCLKKFFLTNTAAPENDSVRYTRLGSPDTVLNPIEIYFKNKYKKLFRYIYLF